MIARCEADAIVYHINAYRTAHVLGEIGVFHDFLQKRIFRPLAMSTTRIINEADIIPNRSSGYRLVDGHLKNQEWVSPTVNTTADGSLYFSVLDLAKWDAALYTEELLKRSSLEQMWTVAKLRSGKPNAGHYGFGWFIESSNGHRVVEKVTIVPVSKEVMEEPVIVPTYHSQAGEGLYKIWPQNPLEPGEYAVVEYTDGKINIQVWDFAVAPGK